MCSCVLRACCYVFLLGSSLVSLCFYMFSCGSDVFPVSGAADAVGPARTSVVPECESV